MRATPNSAGRRRAKQIFFAVVLAGVMARLLFFGTGNLGTRSACSGARNSFYIYKRLHQGLQSYMIAMFPNRRYRENHVALWSGRAPLRGPRPIPGSRTAAGCAARARIHPCKRTLSDRFTQRSEPQKNKAGWSPIRPWRGRSSEIEFAAKLKLSRITRACNLTRSARVVGKGSAICRRRQRVVHVCPLRVVEHVEGLESQLDPHVLSKDEVLEERHVEVVNARAVDGVAMEIAEASRCGRSKGRRVEPLRILSRRLIVTMRGENRAADIVRTNVTESTIPQVSTGSQIAGIIRRAVVVEARGTAPELGNS